MPGAPILSNQSNFDRLYHLFKAFVTDDPLDQEERDDLVKLRFGWIKFHSNKNTRARPGFVHPPDEDGLSRAQNITISGFASKRKNEFFEYKENIPDGEKDQQDVAALKKFNKRYKFSFV